MRQLRDYQQAGVDAVRAEWASGTTRTAIVMATGLGKSTVMGKLATDEAKAGGRVLVLAHRGELLDQLTATCHELAPGVPVGRVQGQRTAGTRRPILMAMAPTLANERRQRQLNRPGKDHPVDLVLIDECHHSASNGYLSILAWAGSFDHVRTLGVTATLVRGDKRGLGDVFESVAFTRDTKWAVDHGWLVRPRGLAVVADHMDLENAKISKGDYQDGVLGELVAQDVGQIVQAWRDHGEGRTTIAFVPTVASAQALAEEFRAAGVATGEVYGHTPTDERALVYKALAEGELQVMVGVGVPTEGFDLPAISCVLVARPTQLPGLYAQMVGRGLRLHPGKADCLVLDVVGTSRTQRLMTLIDLHESADYDSTALPPCEDCLQKPCICEKPERDPDGGRRKLLGPAAYEEVDLFSASTLNWLFTRAGVRFVPAGDRLAVIWTERDGTHSAGHVTARGPENGMWLGERLSLNEAFALAEGWAIAYDPSTATKTSSWRRTQPPSEKQVKWATQSLGIAGAEGMTRARLSDEISIVLASRRLDRRV